MPRPRPVLTVAESSAADRAAETAGTARIELMRTAGRCVAEEIQRRFARGAVHILCGPGDNGGDGFVVAQRLAQAGWAVTVAATGPPRSPAARLAAQDWSAGVYSLDTPPAATTTLIVDAIFGSGLTRALDRRVAGVLRSLGHVAPLVSIDIPTGLEADTGRILGFAPQAALTIALHAQKPAHLLAAGRALCGEIVVADIGLPRAAARLHENTPSLWAAGMPWPDVSAYKMQRGRVVVLGGPAQSTGAARLAARAALRTGAGVVTVLSPQDALMVYAAAFEAVMVRPFDTEGELVDLAADADAAVVGPGAGITEATADSLIALARTGAALIVDADALTVFRDDPQELFSVLDRDDVLTPHAGEFERVFPGLLKASPERITATRAAAAKAGAVVLLKGPDTVIAAPDGRAAINANGAPWLATAGSGDVLTGVIAGLVAQGMDSFDAACAGVWIHAEAGARFGPGLIAEDLTVHAPTILAELFHRRVAPVLDPSKVIA